MTLSISVEDRRGSGPGGRHRLRRRALALGHQPVERRQISLVDSTGTIKSFRPDKDALWLTVEAPTDLMRYIVPKGFIAIDGASLTVVHTGPDWFDVTLIAYSQEKLVLPRKKPGARVNLEVDILAKYVERLIAPQAEANVSLSREFLSEHGYMKEGAR